MSPPHLTFGLSVSGNPALVDVCLERLRAALPDARVFLRTDEDDDPAFDEIARRHRVELNRSGPLYAQHAGGRWWREFFEVDAEDPAHHVFKIDPDTWVRRPFTSLPDPDNVQVFGRPVLDSLFVHRPHMQGGCIGFTRAAATRLRTSGLFDDPGYTRVDYARTLCINPAHIRERRKTGRLSTDLILADVCYRLDVPLVRHPEIHSLWLRSEELADWQARGFEEPVNNPGDRYAATHPHK